MLPKGRDGLERWLSTLLLHHETLGFLITRHIAGHADAQQLVFGGVLKLVLLFGEVRGVDRIITSMSKVVRYREYFSSGGTATPSSLSFSQMVWEG